MEEGGDEQAAAGVVLASEPVPASMPIELRIEARGPSYDFSWSAGGGRWHSLLRGADGRVLSTKRSGGFVGAVFGMYAHDAGASR